MKKFLSGILTIIILFAFLALGVSFSIENTIVDTIDIYVKEEATNEIVDFVSQNANINKEELKKEINKVFEQNPAIKNTIDGYLDKIVSTITSDELIEIDIAQELDSLLDATEPILKNYNITIKKDEVLENLNNKEINEILNKEVKDLKNSMPKEAEVAIKVYDFFRSTNFKIMLIGGIVLCLGLIALLKKSTYRWLTNLGIASIFSGITIGILFPYLVNLLFENLGEDSITLSLSSFNTYGYIIIGLGLIALIIKISLAKLLLKEDEVLEV